MDPVALMSQSVVQYGCCAHGPLITMRIPRYLHSLFPVPLLLLLPYHPDRLTLGNSPSKEKKKRSLPCGPVTHQSQNGLVTFPSWHKSQNGSEMVLLLFRAGTNPRMVLLLFRDGTNPRMVLLLFRDGTNPEMAG